MVLTYILVPVSVAIIVLISCPPVFSHSLSLSTSSLDNNETHQKTKEIINSGSVSPSTKCFTLKNQFPPVQQWDAKKESDGHFKTGDFPGGYCVRVAKAKGLKMAVENGTLPRLDENSELKNCSVLVAEKFGGGKETNISSEMHTCWKFYFLTPPPPSNIRIENETEDSFLIVWEPPKYANSTNRLLHYKLIARWNDTGSDGRQVMATPQLSRSYRYIPSKIVHGEIAENETSFLVENVGEFGGRFQIAIKAVGKVGSSVAKADVYYKGSPFWQMWALQFAICLAFCFLAILIVTCTLKLNGKRESTIYEKVPNRSIGR